MNLMLIPGCKQQQTLVLVLTAKHQCGFCLWPSDVRINMTDNESFRYNYSVAFSNWSLGNEDVVKKFMDSCKKYKIKPGLYYSVNDNEFLKISGGNPKNDTVLPGQVPIPVQNYRQLMLQQLEELWSRYGTDHTNSPLEIWFDGGYTENVQKDLSSLIQRILPHTCAFNGYGISNNPTRWCGSEDGYVKDPNWSTGISGNGDPNSSAFNPTEVDFTLQLIDQWFYIKNFPLHSVEDLVKVYHNSVGLNANMILDIAVPPSGKIDETHMQRYKEFGDYIQKCYSNSPVAIGVGKGKVLIFDTFSNQETEIDRIVIREYQKEGQKIRAFNVSIMAQGQWNLVKQGESIGHKRIVLLDKAINATQIKIEVDFDQEIFAEARNCAQNNKFEGYGFLEK